MHGPARHSIVRRLLDSWSTRMISCIRRLLVSTSAIGLALLLLSSRTVAQTRLVGWGDQVVDTNFTDESFQEIAAGHEFTLARRADGTVAAWGRNQFRQC